MINRTLSVIFGLLADWVNPIIAKARDIKKVKNGHDVVVEGQDEGGAHLRHVAAKTGKPNFNAADGTAAFSGSLFYFLFRITMMIVPG
ncbi:hypothetical protein [Erwinia tasmaniensis]|uniref:hypothetical protein n=1 Tax=Erwinia tasmaniensis TaxID=338565 RepID=UPI0012FEB698|nr:hypothetical protein [Erwinia tasmaniensis]